MATLTDDELQLHGNHETKGRVTIADLYDSLARHEREHLAQLHAAVARLTD